MKENYNAYSSNYVLIDSQEECFLLNVKEACLQEGFCFDLFSQEGSESGGPYSCTRIFNFGIETARDIVGILSPYIKKYDEIH